MSWAELSWSEFLLGRVVLSELSLGRVVLHPLDQVGNQNIAWFSHSVAYFLI